MAVVRKPGVLQEDDRPEPADLRVLDERVDVRLDDAGREQVRLTDGVGFPDPLAVDDGAGETVLLLRVHDRGAEPVSGGAHESEGGAGDPVLPVAGPAQSACIPPSGEQIAGIHRGAEHREAELVAVRGVEGRADGREPLDRELDAQLVDVVGFNADDLKPDVALAGRDADRRLHVRVQELNAENIAFLSDRVCRQEHAAAHGRENREGDLGGRVIGSGLLVSELREMTRCCDPYAQEVRLEGQGRRVLG